MATDSLTGLVNHAAFVAEADRAIAFARRTRRPASLVLLDIDHMRQINDQHGHHAGDQLLRDMARLLQLRLRASDLVGRVGGEEFALLLPDTSQESAMVVANSLCEAFAEVLHCPANRSADDEEHVSFRATFSGGVATLSSPEETAASLLHTADAALRKAKQAGRNTIIPAHNMAVS